MNRRETEQFMAEKGLSYCAWKGYEGDQLFTLIGDATSMSRVIARVKGADGKNTFHWGFYPADEAMDVARRVKRLRKVYVMDVTVVDSAVRI